MTDVVLIAGLRSSGSTLLSEALTELPRAFVFREPKLFRGRVALKEDDVERLLALGIDLRDVAARDRRTSPVEAAKAFREEVLAPTAAVLDQVGFKEIRYGAGWSDVLAELGAVKVVVLARDPRDIYISLAYRRRYRRIAMAGEFAPDTVAADMLGEIAVQEQIASDTDCLRVRYEDLCSDPAVLPKIRDFVGSPVRESGQIGLFKEEFHGVHGKAMTALRVDRWRTESDVQLLAEANEVAQRLAEYCVTWDYRD
jgi:hypothetical protein